MALSDNTRGALLMTAAMATFTGNDIFMKLLADELPFFQILFLRGAVTTALLFFIVYRSGVLFRPISRRDWKLVGLRTVGELGAAYFFITALFNMPIATLMAIHQAVPLTVTLAGALFLGEAVGWRRLSAILVGFCGVLLIVRPGAESFDFYAIYALLSVVAVTVRDLATRRLSSAVPSSTVALFTSIAIVTFGAAGSLAVEWRPITPQSAAYVCGAAVFVIAGYLLSVMAMRVGEIAAVTPFRYTSLIWALILGFIVFAEWPDALTFLGAGIVVATGIFTLYREARLQRAADARRRSAGEC